MSRNLSLLTASLLSLVTASRTSDVVLPGTTPLEIRQPLDELMVENLNGFCVRELAASRQKRAARWHRDYSSAQTYDASVAENRERFRTLIGAVDTRVTTSSTNPHRFELVGSLEESSVIARTSRVTVHSVRWPCWKE